MNELFGKNLFKGACLMLLSICLHSLAGDAPAATNDNNYPAPATERSPAKSRINGAEWKEPERVVPLIEYEEVPLEDIAKDLRLNFQEQIDVLLPFGSEISGNWNWRDTKVSVRLKNVKASEVFQALNLVFEAARTPLHWELTMNGTRPTAVLRNLHEVILAPRDRSSREVERPMVFFVGDLLGDPATGGMSMDQVVETVSQVCKSALGRVNISTHKQAQLIILRGTEDEINFMQSVLAALRTKAELHQAGSKAAEPKSKESKAR
jgi:hypothetical protein